MSKLFNNTTSLNEILETIQNKTAGSGGIDTSDATATTATILSGYTAYVKGKKITGTIETKTSSNLTALGATVTVPAGYYASAASISVLTATQATPSITVSLSGLITASATQTAGYVTAGTKNATKQLTTKAATTYMPGTSSQTIAASTYLTGKQIIRGDSNLVASNIKSGVSIFGVTGTYEGSSSGGGLDINGIIKEYQVYAGENINAGDFVEFITNTYKALNSKSHSCNYAPSCILLENNKVFIAHSYGSLYYLYGTIVQISGTTMTARTTKLSSTSQSCYEAPSCTLLENNKVFIAHSYSSSRYLYGTIVQISGTTMTATTTQLNSTSESCYEAPSCTLLENNKVFIAHSYGSSSRYLYGTIVQISGTTMTARTTQLNSTSYSCMDIPSCTLLENNKVFIAHSYSMGRYLYGTIVQIHGTTMTAKSAQLNSSSDSCYRAPSCTLLGNNKVFIAHSYDSIYYLYGTIVQISGTTTMSPTTTQLNSTSYSCFNVPSCTLLENNKVFIAHSCSNSEYLYGTIVQISGKTMTATTTQLNSTPHSCNEAPSCILLENNKVFIAHSYGSSSYYLYGTIAFNNTYATPYNSTINGIAKTSGASGETIEIYVPN